MNFPRVYAAAGLILDSEDARNSVYTWRHASNAEMQDPSQGATVQLKRAYDEIAPADGTRILVDRVWPRGITRDALKIDSWLKDVAPSTALRKWFGHDPARWQEFQKKYFKELDANPAAWTPILEAARKHKVTLLYGARDTEHNNAVALGNYLQKAHPAHAPGAHRPLQEKP